MTSARPGRGATLTGIVTALVGLALLGWLVAHVGVDEVVAGLRQVGPGFVVILALALARQAARARAWTLLLAGPGGRIPLLRAMAATISGDAVGNVTPLSLLVSEPAKAMYLSADAKRPRGSFPDETLTAGHALAALAAENFFYSLSVAIMIVLGMIALLAAFPVSGVLRWVSLGSLAGMLGIIGAAMWLVWREPSVVGATIARLPWLAGRSARMVAIRTRLVDVVARVRRFEIKTYAFVRESRSRLGGVILCEVLFHVASVAENFVTLWLLTGSTSLLVAFIFDSFQRVVNVAFRVVPLKLGVDEAGAALVAHALGLGSAAGVTLALVRKARVLTWTLVGLGLLIRRGLSSSSQAAGFSPPRDPQG
jgi:hypothetical protein